MRGHRRDAGVFLADPIEHLFEELIDLGEVCGLF
jgi:hypothetical protein